MMENKLYDRLLAILVALGLLCTVSLAGYTYVLQRNCSIITYISNEG